MVQTARSAAEDLFKRPDPDKASDAGKLQDFRSGQSLRKQEARRDELQERLEKRRTGASPSAVFFRAPS
ncbi:hypothetical protein EPK99_11365 [Neorhizobium lilium]|uniref:Uncharacterized protein n=1 Tax=Neorhizobium lilium TaxID=2503024 RepID=A0A444LJM1_9HYPH|nr:hypothetical protein [Neorhizobium lilium]RWX79157.1 hypothetical protein EPK99_11365 [Neorhizobium lilium]